MVDPRPAKQLAVFHAYSKRNKRVTDYQIERPWPQQLSQRDSD